MARKVQPKPKRVRRTHQEAEFVVAYIRGCIVNWRKQRPRVTYQKIADQINDKQLLPSGKRLNGNHIGNLMRSAKPPINPPGLSGPFPGEDRGDSVVLVTRRKILPFALPSGSEASTSKTNLVRSREIVVDLLLSTALLLQQLCAEFDFETTKLTKMLTDVHTTAELARWVAGRPISR